MNYFKYTCAQELRKGLASGRASLKKRELQNKLKWSAFLRKHCRQGRIQESACPVSSFASA